MADKYIHLNNGVPSEKEALVTSAGAADAGKIPGLDPAGKLDETLMPTGVVPEVASIVTSENLAAGDFVNIYDNAGTPTVRKADASAAGKEAHGFVKTSVTSPAAVNVYFEGVNNQVSGATGGPVYLSATTPGGFTSTPPSTSGNVVQRLGIAIEATAINMELGQHYVLA